MLEKIKDKKITLISFLILLMLVFGSVIVEAKLIDVLYLFALFAFFIKFLRLKV